MARAKIGLIGDFDPDKTAHRAIGECFKLAQAGQARPIEPVWLPTEEVLPGGERTLETLGGLWCVPGSPYRSTDGALWAIQHARTRKIPFLGTCGGVQHALLEFARNALGLTDAAHAELEPGTPFPLLQPMRCPLVEVSQKILVVGGGRFRQWYGADCGVEGFHCSYGLNPGFEHLFHGTELEIAARAEDGAVRAVELRGHPFFIGTLFQPERRALAGSLHPLVQAFFDACQGERTAA